VQSGEGHFGYNSQAGNMRAEAVDAQHTDASLTGKIKFGSADSVWAMFWLRSSTTPSGNPWAPTDGYAFGITPAFGGVTYLQESTSGTINTLEAEEPYSISADTWYQVRFEVNGGTVRAKIWPDGQSEPSGWSMEGTDATPLGAGTLSVWTNTWENLDTDIFVDDLELTTTSSGTPVDVITTYNTWNLPESVIEPSTPGQTLPSSRTFTSVYDAGGLPVEQREPGPVTVANAFDSLGRLTSQSSGGATRSFDYDAASRRTSVNHPAGTETFVFDDRSLMVGSVGPAGNTITTYDGDGRVLTRDDPAGLHSFTWRSLDNLATATEPLTGAVRAYTYNAAQQTTRIDYGTPGSSPYRTLGYDAAGRLDTDVFQKADDAIQMSADYAYDWNGNVTQEVLSLPGNSAEGTYDYVYDRADRLTQFSRTSGATTTTDYEWDDAGNRLSAAVQGGATEAWSYDARNRIVTGPDGTYEWDARGTLDRITQSSTVVYDATFDGLARLTQATTDGQTIDYTYDGLDRVATRESDSFGYTGTAIDPSTAGTVRYARSATGALLAVQNGAGSPLIAGLNRHGDLRWLADAAGGTTDTNVMDPFGEPITATGTTGANVGYQGDWTDPTTDDVWMGARWYTPSSSTFRSRDTYSGELRQPVSLNRYTYAGNNPLKYFDANGRCFYPLTICTPTMAAAFGIVQKHNGNVKKAKPEYDKWVVDNPKKVHESISMALKHNYGDRIDNGITKLGVDASSCGPDYECRAKVLDAELAKYTAELGMPMSGTGLAERTASAAHELTIGDRFNRFRDGYGFTDQEAVDQLYLVAHKSLMSHRSATDLNDVHEPYARDMILLADRIAYAASLHMAKGSYWLWANYDEFTSTRLSGSSTFLDSLGPQLAEDVIKEYEYAAGDTQAVLNNLSAGGGDSAALKAMFEGKPIVDPHITEMFAAEARGLGWTLPEGGGGATIGGRWYTEHALERMAPDTLAIRAELEARALARAEARGLKPGTPEFRKYWNDYGPDPRGVPPMVVEAEIASPGSTSVKVITGPDGRVITVIPR
jgi:RHS repeat-associated protein